jgi:hypothetical protein
MNNLVLEILFELKIILLETLNIFIERVDTFKLLITLNSSLSLGLEINLEFFSWQVVLSDSTIFKSIDILVRLLIKCSIRIDPKRFYPLFH